MAYDGYACLRVRVDDGVATVTIDHPSINLFDLALITEMDRVGRELEADAGVRVVVLQSANPEFLSVGASKPGVDGTASYPTLPGPARLRVPRDDRGPCRPASSGGRPRAEVITH